MIVAMEALDAWCPPTLSPDGFGRTRLAWSTIAVASHSTRCSTVRAASSSVRTPPEACRVAIEVIRPLLGRPAQLRRRRALLEPAP